nr:ribonucleoside-triphosphate reductase [Candidatus Paceibacterota bacterium]
MTTKQSPIVSEIVKRTGARVPFDIHKITRAVEKAMRAAGEFRDDAPQRIADAVLRALTMGKQGSGPVVPTVEGVQDVVEQMLMILEFPASAKAFILYRAERTRIREVGRVVPEHVRKLADASRKYFKDNPLGEFVYLRTYARWIESEGRRETWIETVDRYISFMKENLGTKLSADEYTEVREAILRQDVMPSMRLMQFAGEAARRCNTCAYNCTFIAPEALDDLAEIMYLSMQGCGVGFAVESQNIEKLPQIRRQTNRKQGVHTVGDSKEGWCDALKLGLHAWYEGSDIEFDYSLIRPAGARLTVMGGKASGPEPLRALLEFAREKILRRQGRRLRAIDAHDIICK